MLKKLVVYVIFTVMLFSSVSCNNINEEDKYEKLWYGITCGNEQVMIESINEGADINKFEYHSSGTVSPIIWACQNRNSKRFINTMLKYDINPDFIDISGATVFYESINERDEVFDKLISLKPDLNFIDPLKHNAIDNIILSNNIDIYFERLEKLINAGAIVTIDNIKNLIKSIGNNKHIDTDTKLAYVKAMKILLDNYEGNDVDKNILSAYSGNFKEDNVCKNDAVLFGIAGYCNKDILEANLKSDADLDFLLRVAIIADNLENTKYLLEKGANIKDTDEDTHYKSGLYYAVKYNNYDLTKYILNLDFENIDSCVNEAVNNNNLKILNLLFDKGANINNKEAFEYALIHNYDEIVKCFVKRGFNVNACDRMNTASNYSVWSFLYGDLDTVKFICANSNKMSDKEIQEAGYNAVKQGNIDLLNYLKELGCDFSVESFNESDNSRLDSELIIAISKGYFDVVKFLVENGANTSRYTKEEQAELIEWAKKSEDIYNYLSESGTGIVNKNTNTAN